MKPLVAIDGVLDHLFFKVYRCISVDDCAQTEILVCAFGADSERGARPRAHKLQTHKLVS